MINFINNFCTFKKRLLIIIIKTQNKVYKLKIYLVSWHAKREDSNTQWGLHNKQQEKRKQLRSDAHRHWRKFRSHDHFGDFWVGKVVLLAIWLQKSDALENQHDWSWELLHAQRKSVLSLLSNFHVTTQLLIYT